MTSSAPSTCAAAARDLAEPPAGTASTALTWLLLEQPGPWGAKALTASHLDPSVGRALEKAAKDTGVRVALSRRPGRHSDDHAPGRPRHVVIAHTAPGAGWVRRGAAEDPAELLALDLARLGAGHHDGFGTPHTGEPLALVCTNGRRDRCCALLGRPLADELAASGHGDVWEITHLGGHRFAPTMLVLPHGYAYARQHAASAKAVLAAAAQDRVVTGSCRGRSAWDNAGQAAELAVRDLTGEDHADALTVLPAAPAAPAAAPPADGPRTVRVRHRDGRHWTVTLGPLPPGTPARPQSCGAEPVLPKGLRVLTVTEDA